MTQHVILPFLTVLKGARAEPIGFVGKVTQHSMSGFEGPRVEPIGFVVYWLLTQYVIALCFLFKCTKRMAFLLC